MFHGVNHSYFQGLVDLRCHAQTPAASALKILRHNLLHIQAAQVSMLPKCKCTCALSMKCRQSEGIVARADVQDVAHIVAILILLIAMN